jgi:hypothetical protein
MLWTYFFLPLIKNIYGMFKHLFLLDFKELHTDFTLRLPFIFLLGLIRPYQEIWFKWYKFTDIFLIKYFNFFNPDNTITRIKNNFLCPNYVIQIYFNFITEDQDFRQKRIKMRLLK